MTSVRMREDPDARAARPGVIRNIVRLAASEMPPAALFEAVVAEIRKVMSCERCSLGRRDPVTGRHEYWHVASDLYVEPLREEGEHAWEGVVVYSSHRPFYVADLANVEVTTRRRLLAAGLRSTLVTPIIRDGECIAHFSLSSTRPHAFSTEDIVLLGEIADCLAMVIRTATLCRESREAAERLEIARNVAHAVASTLDPQLLFRVIAGHVRKAVACERCDIRRVDSADAQGGGVSPDPVYVPDTRVAKGSEAERLAREGFLSRLVVPVVRDGKCVARIELVSHAAKAFSRRDIELLASVADHVAPAIENARLHCEVRRVRDYFQSVFDESDVAMIIASDQGRIQRCNAAARRMLGYSDQELVGADMEMLVPEERRAEWSTFLRGHDASCALTLDGRVSCRDGGTLVAHVGVSPIVSAPRGVIAYCATFKDLTERDALVRRLEDKSADMQRFTYGVSHDLKSPIITIKGFLGAIRESIARGDSESALADLGQMGNAADSMQELLDDLLTLSRLGAMESACSDVSLSEVVDEALDLVDGSLAERDVAVRIAGELPVVHGDRVRLRELVQNLLENAIKYTRNQAHPEIEIGSARAGRERVFYVRDNGIGIDPRHQADVFDIFHRVEQGVEGSGLGLAIVKQIVERHGGRVWVESGGDGQGSTFKLTLPPGLE